MIKRNAQLADWSRAALCPCRDIEMGAPNPSCPTCQGKGVWWNFPPGEVWFFSSGMRIQRQWRDMGQYQSGDLVVTVGSDSPFYESGEFDRILMKQSTEPFSNILTFTGSETLNFAIACIEQTFWLDPTTQAQILGGTPAYSWDGKIDWTNVVGGSAPPAGAQYSISGRRIPEYFVFADIPGDRAHCYGQPLPRRVTLRKYELFGR